MKRNLRRVLMMVIPFISLLCGMCYADVIDPMFPYEPSSPSIQEPERINVVSIIMIGIVIAVIVVTAIIVLARSKKKNDKEENDAK